MFDYLTDYTIKHVWCSPPQDYQYIFQPMRLSGPHGVINIADVQWNRHRLPKQKTRYHIYQIGQLSPYLLNTLTDDVGWVSFQTLVNENLINIHAYLKTGKVLPRFECWIKRTESRNVVIAVEDQPLIGDITATSLFVRFYSNAFYSSERSFLGHHRLYCDGIVVGHRAEAVDFITRAQQRLDEGKGVVNTVHNGWLVDRLRIDQIQVGDKLEALLDTSIKAVFEVDVESLHTFVSTLDNQRKYLIFRPNGCDQTIDYHDDIDCWLTQARGQGREGIFYHKATDSSMRMVTHKDYSIPVHSLVEQVRHHTHWHAVKNTTLRLLVRHSGFQRPLQYEHNRIHELLQLDEHTTQQAMIGSHSTIQEWRAASLERSCYTQLMRAPTPEQLTKEAQQCAYGYHGIAHIIANTPYTPTIEDGKKGILLNWRHRFDTTLFEYDGQGRLIDSVYHNSGHQRYYLRNPHADCVEAIVGLGCDYHIHFYDRHCTDLDDQSNYRGYVSDRSGGASAGQWRAAVRGEDYIVADQTWIWIVDPDKAYTMLRSDVRFLLYDEHVFPHNGILTLTVKSRDLFGDEEHVHPPELPFGRLDLFLNGYSLIENLDYRVQWPEIVICNKEYLDPDQDTQRVTIRAYGFLTPELKPLPHNEFDFVRHGLLSVNQRYNLREGIVMRYIVDGKLYDRRSLKYSESDWGLTLDHIRNGAPYQISEIVVPMKELVDTDVYTYRQSSIELDQRIEDYLTLYRPEPTPDEIELIERRYMILSPFISRIHYDLESGYFYPTGITGHYNTEKLRQWVKPYEWLLEFDPVIKGVHLGYVAIHPHHLFTETTLDLYQYTFLNRIIEAYMPGRVSLSTHVRLKGSSS